MGNFRKFKLNVSGTVEEFEDHDEIQKFEVEISGSEVDLVHAMLTMMQRNDDFERIVVRAITERAELFAKEKADSMVNGEGGDA